MNFSSSSYDLPVHASSASSIPSLYVLKALLAFVVVTCHSPLALSWLQIPGGAVELFFSITGYFIYVSDLSKVQVRIWKSIKKVLPIILILQIFYNIIAPPRLGPLTSSYWTYFQWVFMGFSTFASGHLWYLTALLFGLQFFSLYLYVMKGRWVPLLFFLIFTMGRHWTFSYVALWKTRVGLCLQLLDPCCTLYCFGLLDTC